MDTITANSKAREEMIDITSEVAELLPSGDGVCVLFVQHTTCGLTVNENADPDVQFDMLGFLRRLIPQLTVGAVRFDLSIMVLLLVAFIGMTMALDYQG